MVRGHVKRSASASETVRAVDSKKVGRVECGSIHVVPAKPGFSGASWWKTW
jgi:hypothetical protein